MTDNPIVRSALIPVVSLLLAAAIVMTAGLALYFDARGNATKDDGIAASLEFMRLELQLFSSSLDFIDDIAAAAVFGSDPIVLTPERSLQWNGLVGGLDALSKRGDTVGYLSLELVEAIAREAEGLPEHSEDSVFEYYRVTIALWTEFEPPTRSLVGRDHIDLIVGSQALFTTRRIRRAVLRDQAEVSGLPPSDPVFAYLMETDRFTEADAISGSQRQFQMVLRPLLEAAGVDTAFLTDAAVESGFVAVDLSRERNVHTAERDQLIVLATERIDEAFYEVLENDRSRLLESAGGFRQVANVYLGFVLAVGFGLILLVRFMLRISRREGDALAARELAISRQEEFIGLVSHELRTPITSILGYSEVLNEHLAEFTSEEIGEMIGTIADQSNHVAGLVDDLLMLFRVDAGHLHLEIEDFCVVDVVRDVLLMVPSTFAERVAVVGDREAGVRADSRRVIQIIRNVLDNARKYGGDRVTVDVKAGKGRVLIRIADNGPGIELDQVEKVFEAFGQLDEHGRQGSGLGLAISSKLADAMGGSLSYDNGGAGATFVLDLPGATRMDRVSSSVSVG